ncbi:uncharacterized protein LOC127241080 [Andrographis paniculata]|uniref:uncharacterized protein LOC127241080 n=1 Tax=Andrographis paniculata TaxID=175694 RepID=UPI0021E7E3B8|nr:uncharacterized protein LOC127241080 [Andrographis paniculata]
MGGRGNVKEIEVRSLMGDSIRVSIESNKTIEDLKLLLKQRFHPANSSPNFHLFLRGVKLGPHGKIGDYLIEDGDFLVIIPFVKKGKEQRHQVDISRTSSEDPKLDEKESELARSSWSDLMQDLSSFQEISTHENPPVDDLKSVNSENEKDHGRRISSRKTKGKKVLNDGQDLGCSDDVLFGILQSYLDNTFDEQKFEKVLKLMESSCCLSNLATGYCLLREASDTLSSELAPSAATMCLCPLWLKGIIMAFSFINVYSACLQMCQKKITADALKGPLEQLHKVGFQRSTVNLELLSQLCPQIVRIVYTEETKLHDVNSLVIIKESAEKCNQHEDDPIMAVKRPHRSQVMKSVKKRDSSFKAVLSEAIRSLMLKNGTGVLESFSLENLLVSLKTVDAPMAKADMKQERKRYSATSSSQPPVQCHDTKTLNVDEMVEHLRNGIGSQGQVVHIEKINARNAKYVEIPCHLSAKMKCALNRAGITRLYSHQAESIQASLAEKNVIVATMTSSGKSLCYNIPVLEVLSHDPLACALYLFPTKALAQDQYRALLTLSHGLDDSLNVGIYDGDTSQEDRLWLRDNARLLITNPDMLHISILPFHGQFRRILANVKFIVIDEAHTYKGTFGCHASLIFRRLRRICSHVYSSEPSFIFSTATSSNPQEHAMELANLSTVGLINHDGSPSGLKHFMLWNPPLCLKNVWKRVKTSNKSKKNVTKSVVPGRSSPILEVSSLFAEIVQHGLRCIAFCKTRKLCELVLSYTREILHESAPHLMNKVYSYRGGYIAEDRRRIESDFFNGNICGIAATNALELGIDVGDIDVTLHLGFPGSIASLWQQAGRSGRREKPSLAIYVAFEGPLDQYFMKFPHKLFRGSIECCHVDPTNDQVLQQHLSCAALEHPLSLLHDEKYFGPGLEGAITILKNKGCLSTDISRDCASRIWTYIGHEKSPAGVVNVRAIETERYKVIEMTKNEVLEEIEESKAFFQVYEGAVYMNQAKTYLVKNLDLSSKIAWCQQADLNYYTKTRDYTDIHVIGGNIAYPARIAGKQCSRTSAQANTCKVTTTWFGFRRIWKKTSQVFDSVELSLPDYSYESQAVWIRVPQSVKTAVENLQYSFRGGLHAAGHALLNVVPLFVICNQSDLASECANPHDDRYVPERVLLYDPHPGGTGISLKLQPRFVELLTAAFDLLSSCYCSGDTGCPNCVQNLACNEYNEVLHKDAAVMIIKGILDAEESQLNKNAE